MYDPGEYPGRSHRCPQKHQRKGHLLRADGASTTSGGDAFKLWMFYYQSSRYYYGVTLVTQLVYATVSKDSTDTTGRTYVYMSSPKTWLFKSAS
jgi:hypothetical protein